ncbi:hypothetical protein G7Y89_g11607 [Cudoniella acicularis]|uniref:Uncharacterized protein n=1 Tax=Cudoniella acicularis TaxID=354080 RepID=A0A8H4RC20_9HELO|nr:hypothetical protein G7Y89_g11607 [Cudoniella acicularis]
MVIPTFVFLPLYIYPINSSWANVTQSIQQYPDLNFQIVVAPNLINVIPDQNYITNLEILNNFTNVQTLGYVPTNWATRNITTVQSQISAYASWANYTKANISVSGIFFDEAPSVLNTDNLSYMTNVSAFAKQSLGAGRNTVMFNPGVTVDRAWYNISDAIIIFEDTWQKFNFTKLNSTVPPDLVSQSITLIYNFTINSTMQTDVVSNLTGAKFGGTFITTQDGYTSLSALWPEFCEAVSINMTDELDDRDNDDGDGDDGDDGDGNGDN